MKIRMIDIEEHNEGDVCRIHLSGRFDADNSTEVEEFLTRKIVDGCHRMVLNLEKVPAIASAGLRMVVVFARKLRRDHGGDLRLTGLQPKVRRVFELSGLHDSIHIFDDETAAVESFLEEN